MSRSPQVRDRVVVTLPDYFMLRTRIVEVRSNSAGKPLYVMENGQWLYAKEFEIEEEVPA